MTFNDDERYNEINELEVAAREDTLSQLELDLFGENGHGFIFTLISYHPLSQILFLIAIKMRRMEI